jgi:hypothetical protein
VRSHRASLSDGSKATNATVPRRAIVGAVAAFVVLGEPASLMIVGGGVSALGWLLWQTTRTGPAEVTGPRPSLPVGAENAARAAPCPQTSDRRDRLGKMWGNARQQNRSVWVHFNPESPSHTHSSVYRRILSANFR